MAPPEAKREGSSSGIVIPERIRNITKIIGGKLSIDLPSFKNKLFDDVWVGKHSRTHLQARVPVNERELPLPENVTVLSQLPNNNVARLMKKITKLANSKKGFNNERNRLKYQSLLFSIFSQIGQRLQESVDTDNAVYFPPLRGADLIRSFFQAQGIIKNPENIAQFEMKREYLEDGVPVVGRIDKYYPEGNFETGIFIDDCLASDASVSASIALMRKKYPTLKNITIAVSAATRRGLEEAALKHPDVKFIAATTVYEMNDHFYLLRTPEEKDLAGRPYPKNTFYVGDMGEWARKLSAKKNKKAPWNRFRT